jgi:type II secretory pathway component PulJ
VEILVAATLGLILMGAVATVFGRMGNSINNSRATLEQFDRLRAVELLMHRDLDGVTVTMLPPRRPEAAEGYFEYIEGTHLITPWDNTSNQRDYTVNESDDILMFTTRSTGQPFVGRYAPVNGQGSPVVTNLTTIQSELAEVAWFVRGRTLHRRVLLIAPGATAPSSVTGYAYYQYYDVSMHLENGVPKFNSLSDLTKRECRYGHPFGTFPFDVRQQWGQLGLPTLNECSGSFGQSASWTNGSIPISATGQSAATQVDYWSPQAFVGTSLAENCLNGKVDGARPNDDVILTNVIGFDVTVWDPQAPQANGGVGGYVELGSGTGHFSAGNLNSLSGLTNVYDTWSFHYEQVGTNPAKPSPGPLVDGFDDNNTGIVDNVAESIAPPPYAVPLRGIQVKIRIFEPDSRNIREVTLTHDFLPK